MEKHKIKFGDRVSFGDLYQESRFQPDPNDKKDQSSKKAKADKIRALMSHDKWEYLYALNTATNDAVHKARILKSEAGVRTLVCPADHCDVPLLKEIAVERKFVDDPSKLVVKPDDRITPPMGPASSPKVPSPPRLAGKPRAREDGGDDDSGDKGEGGRNAKKQKDN